VNSSIPLSQFHDHLEQWPVAEYLIFLPNEVKDAFQIRITEQRKLVWCLHKEIYISPSQLTTRIQSKNLTFKTIGKFQKEINQYIKENQPNVNRSNKYFYKCQNSMGPFVNWKANLIMLNGSKLMSPKAISLVDNEIWETREKQIVEPELQREKLSKIGTLV